MTAPATVEALYRALVVSPCRCLERPVIIECPRCAAVRRYEAELHTERTAAIERRASVEAVV
jgi:hypothetical protein